MNIRPSSCHCLTWPCCGCGNETSQEEQEEQFMAQVSDQDRELSGVTDLDDEDENEEQEPGDEPWDGFRSDADADQNALNSVYGYDPEDCDTPLGDFFGGE